MAITLINPFVVPAEYDDDEFLRRWHEASDRLPHAPGFIEAHMHRNTGDGDQTFRFINIALWESAEAYRAAFRGPAPTPHEIAGVKFYPGLFEQFLDIKKGS